MNGSIQLHQDGTTAWITMNQPDKLNALSLSMWQQLRAVLHRVNDHPGIHVVVIRGEGTKAFSSGADISEFMNLRQNIQDIQFYDDCVHHAIEEVRNLRAISLAMIYGQCVGGGTELALATDLRMAAHTSRLGITPARLGIVYGPAETRELMERVGSARALDLLASGRLVSAEEGRAMGLVDFMIEENRLDGYVEEYLAQIHRNSWTAIGRMKRMVNAIRHEKVASINHSDLISLVYDAYESKDYHIRVRQFLDQ